MKPPTKEQLDRFVNVPGHLYEEEGRLLQRLAAGRVALDIGTHHGKSAIAMAATAIQVISIDTYRGDDMISAPYAAETVSQVSLWELGYKIQLVAFDWYKFVTSDQIQLIRPNFAFYDAAHSPPVYEATFLEWVRYSGITLFAVHDYKPLEEPMRHVVAAVDKFEASGWKRSGQVGSIVWWNLGV